MTGSSGAESTAIGDQWDGQSGHHGGTGLSEKGSYECESEKQSADMRPGGRVSNAKEGLCRDLGRSKQEPDQKVHACDWNRRKVGIGRRGQRSQQGWGTAGCTASIQHCTVSIWMQRKAVDLVFGKSTTAVGPSQEAELRSVSV